MTENSIAPAWDRETFIARLQAIGMSRYHDKHPFHQVMNTGKLTPEQLRGWVANRFYYQRNIPIKDAAILSNCPIREVRRLWLHRITDHDGLRNGEGGIEAWLRLAEATGLTREETLEERHVLPGVRFAVDAYVSFARSKPWPIAVASSLTELFAPDLMSARLKAFETHYTWVPAGGLEYFRSRLTQARVDSDQGLELTITHCNTHPLQEEAVHALCFKCDLLWAMLDAMMLAYAKNLGAEPTDKSQGRSHNQQIDPGTRLRLSSKARVQTDKITGKPALLYPEGVLLLNPTGAAIVELCDGQHTVAGVVTELATRYNLPADRLSGDVTEYLGRLRERGLLELMQEQKDSR